MPIGIGEDHEELRRTVRRWTESRCGPEVPRALLDADKETLPAFWESLAEQGWLGLHVDEAHGGQGFGFSELAVVVEELARAAGPGPGPPHHAGRRRGRRRPPDDARRQALLRARWPTASRAGRRGPARQRHPRRARVDDAGTLRVSGTLRPVLGAVPARVRAGPGAWSIALAVALAVGRGEPAGRGDRRSLVRRRPRRARASTSSPWAASTRRAASGRVRLDARGGARRRSARRASTRATVVDLALVIAAAECAGGARWCLEVATEHAIARRQFGRPIGQFQAIKHKLADMLVSVEQVTALAWDAAAAADARATAPQLRLSAALAGAVALDAYVECAKACIQILGGMGFTWEHDAHIHLRRAHDAAPGPRRQRRPARGRGARRAGRQPPGARHRAARRRPSAIRAEVRAAGRPGGRRRQGQPPPGHGRARAAHAALARRPTGATPGRSSSSSSTRSSPPPTCTARTWPWGRGRCPRSSPTGPPSSRSAS